MRRPRIPLLGVAAVLAAACSGGGPILANPPAAIETPTPTPAATPRAADPIPISLPRDDAPHDRLTEWWYYTGHLRASDGRTFGFEFVIFRAERGSFPVTWASHLAVTDEDGGSFRYAQRSEIGAQVDQSAAAPAAGTQGFDLAIAGHDLLAPVATDLPEPWTMAGSNGIDALTAIATSRDGGSPAPFGIDLALEATKPAALHDIDGWIDFGPAGGSYYYSRTTMDAAGTLVVDGEEVAVSGTAWFDHQWGDFISVGGSGWDWFAVNLEDGTDLTLSLIRDVQGAYSLVYGTLVDAAGETQHLDRDDFTVKVTDMWTSPATGTEYPAGWTIELPAQDLTISLQPTVDGQELDTRATTGVVYWEGSQVVDATRNGVRMAGQAYVELTGYAPLR